MEKQQGSKYKVLYNIFNAGGERRKTGNPQNQRIDGWYDNAPRVLANQLCALSPCGEQSVANVERAESFPLPPSLFLPPPPSPSSLPLHGPAFICPPSFCTSNAISAVNAGCARRRRDYNGSVCTRAANEIRKNQAFGLRAPERRLLNDARLKQASVFSATTASLLSRLQAQPATANPPSASAAAAATTSPPPFVPSPSVTRSRSTASNVLSFFPPRPAYQL